MSARKAGGAGAGKLGAIGFTIAALIFTIITAYALSTMLTGTQYAGEPVQDVVVAAREIPASERISEDDLKIIKWPVSAVPEGAYASPDEILGTEPRVPINTIIKGEPILSVRLASASSGTGMASLVPRTRRGFPVPVDSWIAEARLVYPGAVVDVLTTLRNNTDRTVNTKVILQNIRVLAVDGAVDAAQLTAKNEKRTGGGGSQSVVTLLVTPDEAEILALASREGDLDLMLRNATDDELVETFGITPPELLGHADPKEVEAARAAMEASAAASAGYLNPAVPKRPTRRGPRRKVHEAENTGPDPSGGAPAMMAAPPPRRDTGRTKTIDLGAK